MTYPATAQLPAIMQNYRRIFKDYTEPFVRAWRHRELIRAVARREYLSRYSGAALGWIWAVVVLIFFSCSTNQEYYTFPAYLPLLILLAGALATYRTADADMESYEAKLRRAQAFDVSVRVGFDDYADRPSTSTPTASTSPRASM